MRVFGIGLNKTGTTTLGSCLSLLGYMHTSFNLSLLEDISQGHYDRLYQTAEEHTAFEDWPYPLVFEKLDQRFPQSKFILTRRVCAESWLVSLNAHSLRTDPLIGTKARQLVYGFPYPQIDPRAHLSFYEAHLERVRKYFHRRTEDLLEVCWEEDPSWDHLCRFLGKALPPCPFPHENRAVHGQEHRIQANLRQLKEWQSNHPRIV
jgi:hypothetical protein